MEDIVKIFDEMDENERQNSFRIFVMHGNVNEDTIGIVEKYPECFSHAYKMGKAIFNKFMNSVIDLGYFNDVKNREKFINELRGKFILGEHNMYLIDYCPRLLEISFDLHFEETLQVLTSHINNYDFPGNYKEVFMWKSDIYILEALSKNNYVLDDLYGELRTAVTKPLLVLEISYDNDPLKTIYELLKYPYISTTKEFLKDKNIYKILSEDKNFVMTKEIYKSLSNFLSDEELENLVAHSLKNKPFTTVINGANNELAFLFFNMGQSKMEFIKKTLKVNYELLNRNESQITSITNLINKYPYLMIDILKEDYKVGLKILGSTKIDKLKESVLLDITKELLKHKYVASYIDNNIYLLKPMFMQSLENDFNATMRVIKGVYSSTSFYDDMINEYGEKLRDIIIYNLSHNVCEGADSICEFIKRDPEILIEAMRKNPQVTIENLSGVNRPTFLGKLSLEQQKEIEKYLIDTKFTLSNGDNYLFMSMNSSFVFASLENDYMGTRKLIIDSKSSLTSTIYSKEEFDRIIRLCKEHDDRELLLNICGKNSYLLGELLKSDLDLAYEAIDNLKKPSPLEKDGYEYLLSIFNSIGVEKLDYVNHPNLISLFMWGRMKGDISKEEQEKLASEGVPLNYLKLHDKELMEKYLTKEEMKWQEKLYFDSAKYEYKREDEIELLKFLGSDFDCVEDELADLHSKNITKKDLTLSQMLLFAMFMKKDQFNKGIRGYSLKLYDYTDDVLSLGSHNAGSKTISLFNGQDGLIADLLRIIVHENNHAKQRLDSLNCDVNSDKDIVLYAKDELLRIMLVRMYQFDFYKENYYHTLMERDADLKAIMEVASILKIDPFSKELSNKNVTSLDEAFLTYGMDRTHYDVEGSRTLEGVRYPLEDIFIKYLNICIKNQTISVPNILRKYPVIDYEYNLYIKPITRKTLTELMVNYNHGNTMDKEIIRAVLMHRFDGLYNKDYLSDIMEFEKILKENNIDDEELQLLVMNSYSNNLKRELNGKLEETDKYLEYINYMLDNDKRISNKDFKERIGK